MKKSHYKQLITSCFFIVTLLSIFLPGILLHFTFQSDLSSVKKVPEALYHSSNPAISKNASAKLSEYERIKLISGAWDSTQKAVDSSQSNITQNQAANLAREAVKKLYLAGCYPYHFDSAYDNWYAWTAQCFQCTENAFHTYSAYCWLVTFYKYDDDEFHDVLITEDGTLLNIRNNRPADSKEQLSGSWNSYMEKYFKDKYPNIPVSFFEITESGNLPAYNGTALTQPDIQSANIVVLNNANISSFTEFNNMIKLEIPESTKLYYTYQCSNNKYFMITIIPWEQSQ